MEYSIAEIFAPSGVAENSQFFLPTLKGRITLSARLLDKGMFQGDVPRLPETGGDTAFRSERNEWLRQDHSLRRREPFPAMRKKSSGTGFARIWRSSFFCSGLMAFLALTQRRNFPFPWYSGSSPLYMCSSAKSLLIYRIAFSDTLSGFLLSGGGGGVRIFLYLRFVSQRVHDFPAGVCLI